MPVTLRGAAPLFTAILMLAGYGKTEAPKTASRPPIQ